MDSSNITISSSLKAIVIGASSGIGRELVKELSRSGYEVGFTARRLELLESLQKEISSRTVFRFMDISKPEEAAGILDSLIKELGGLDLLIINAGVNIPNPFADWKPDCDTISVNVQGFAALADEGVRYFLRQGTGHLVGISSIAGHLGNPKSPAYNASKAFMSRFLQGLYFRLRPRGIFVTDIRPGFVDTAMVAGSNHKFWVASPQKAAAQIVQAIRAKRPVAYVSRRWVVIAFLCKLTPLWVFERLFKRIKR